MQDKLIRQLREENEKLRNMVGGGSGCQVFKAFLLGDALTTTEQNEWRIFLCVENCGESLQHAAAILQIVQFGLQITRSPGANTGPSDEEAAPKLQDKSTVDCLSPCCYLLLMRLSLAPRHNLHFLQEMMLKQSEIAALEQVS